MSDPSPEPGSLAPRAELLAILALASGAFVMALNANVMAALLPYLKADPRLADPGVLGIRDTELKLLVGAAGGAGTLGAFLLGPLVDIAGRRAPMAFGMLAFSLASFGHWASDGYVPLLVSRLLSGFAAGVVYSSASAAVADLVPYARRGKAMGIFTAGMFLGLPAGLPLAGWLGRLGHWQSIYLLQGVIGLLAMVAIRIYLPAATGKGHAFRENLPKLFTLEVGAALASVTLYVGAFFTSVQFAGSWLDDSGLVPKHDQWIVWLVLGLCSALGSLLLARISDLIGKRLWSNLTCIAVALLLLALGTVTGPVGLVAVGVPLAIASAARTGPFQALVSDLVPESTRGTLMGVRSAAVNLGTGLFPLLAFDDYQRTLWVAAGGVFLAFVLVQLFVEKR